MLRNAVCLLSRPCMCTNPALQRSLWADCKYLTVPACPVGPISCVLRRCKFSKAFLLPPSPFQPDCACLSCQSYKLCSAEMQIQQSLPPSSFPLFTRLCLPVLPVLKAVLCGDAISAKPSSFLLPPSNPTVPACPVGPMSCACLSCWSYELCLSILLVLWAVPVYPVGPKNCACRSCWSYELCLSFLLVLRTVPVFPVGPKNCACRAANPVRPLFHSSVRMVKVAFYANVLCRFNLAAVKQRLVCGKAHTHTFACVHTHTQIHMNANTHKPKHTHARARPHTHPNTQTHTRTCTHTHPNTQTHIHTCTHTLTHIHTQARTHTRTYTHAPACACAHEYIHSCWVVAVCVHWSPSYCT